MSIKRKNLGDSLEEIMKFKTKAGKEYKRSKEDYCNLTVKAAKSVVNELDNILGKLDNNMDEDTYILLCDKIFSLLVEREYKQLDKSKNDFDYWSDINDKFNS